MLLSVPVAAARIHEPALAEGHCHLQVPSGAAPASTSTATTTTSGSAAPKHQHQPPRHPGSPARRVMRAVLSFRRQRQQQQQHQQHQQRQQARGGRRPKGGSAVVALAASSASPAPLQQHQPLLLHSAASLPGSSAHELAQEQHAHGHHHHRRRRGDADHDSSLAEEAAAAAAAAAASEPVAAATAAAAAATPSGRPSGSTKNNNNNNNPLRALLRFVVHHAHRAARAARPHGPGLNDATPVERCVNVLTSLPFLAVGLHVLRTRRAGAARRFGRSFVAVGCVAGAYHACPRRHPLRRPLRLLDYYSIAWSSSLLREAVGVKLPPWAAAVAACATPVKPTAVTAGNLAVIELAFARAAFGGGGKLAAASGGGGGVDVRRAWRRHLVAAGAGLSCFLAEDAVLESGRVNFNAFHGVWHLLSAAALGLANALLGHVEQALLIEAAEVVAEGQV